MALSSQVSRPQRVADSGGANQRTALNNHKGIHRPLERVALLRQRPFHGLIERNELWLGAAALIASINVRPSEDTSIASGPPTLGGHPEPTINRHLKTDHQLPTAETLT